MTGIPSISGGDVRAAMVAINAEGVPAGRTSSRFCVADGNRHYPPKYVVSLAVRHAVGHTLRSEVFSGGQQTNRLLRSLGFQVVACKCGGAGEGSFRLGVRGQDSGMRRVPPVIGRVIVQGKPPRTPQEAERALIRALDRLPGDRHVKFLITPGGFIWAPEPEGLSDRTGWESSEKDFALLVGAARSVVDRVVTDRVLRAARGRVDVLTVGVDVCASEDDYEIAELVAVVDVAGGRVAQWTGKSYPTTSQEGYLVQVVDLPTHCLRIAGERVLVLGCHDLNMFSARGRKAQTEGGARRRRCDDMRALVDCFRPTVVLQHPHTTDHPGIWRAAWGSLTEGREEDIKAWASGICYRNPEGPVRAPLKRVLALTRGPDGTEVEDVLIRPTDYREPRLRSP